MKKNKKTFNLYKILVNRYDVIAIIGRLFFSDAIDLFESSKVFSGKLLIRYANIRV